MKRLGLVLLFAVAISVPASGQSSIVFDVGTNIDVTSTADICADVVTINGTFSGDGTKCSAPLPITLVSFTVRVTPGGSSVLLEWKTLSEINNYGFYVQTKRADAADFTDVAGSFVPGHGTTNAPQSYSYSAAGTIDLQTSYRLKQIDLDGSLHVSEAIMLTTTGVAETTPVVYSLDQNFPNPSNPSTAIRYGIPARSHVALTVFNALGQQVSVLQNGEQDAGYHEVRFDGSGFATGVYFYRIQAGSYVKTKKLLLVR